MYPDTPVTEWETGRGGITVYPLGAYRPTERVPGVNGRRLACMAADDANDEMPDVDPTEFARAMLAISPEDAAKVRERTPATRKRAEKQEGPTADYGDE
jgi:hypothetical protein